MTEFEIKLIRTIREAEDSAKAMAMVVDMIHRLNAGEEVQSIARNYGVKLVT